MAEFPALPLWTDAYLGDTTHLTTVEHGAYLLLLIVAWRSKGTCLPNDDKLLARYARCTPAQWKRLRPIMEPFFKITADTWVQGRLTDEANAVRARRESAIANGRASALKRKGRHATERDAHDIAGDETANSDARTTTPISTSITKEEEDKSSPSGAGENQVETTSANGKRYAFAGMTIRLNDADLDRWAKTYHAIPDIRAELAAIDAWFQGSDVTDAKRKGWFNAVPGMLSRKHNEALERNYRRDARSESEPDFTKIPGVKRPANPLVAAAADYRAEQVAARNGVGASLDEPDRPPVSDYSH